ncbi:MAG TPA: hypothetical protein VGC38_00790 [Pseudolabrys sp.]
MRRCFLVLVALLIAAPALAQEPVGCDKFKWPLNQEKALLASAKPVESGGDVQQSLAAAVTVTLVPFADAKLPTPPSRAPKSPDSYAGFVRVPSPPKAGTYRVTLSQGAWVDVVQDEHAVKSGAFSGATGCEGVRKSVKFDLTATPFIIELSGTTAHAIGVVVTQD